MPKFAVSFFSQFDSDIKMRVIEATSRADAMASSLEDEGFEVDPDLILADAAIEAIKQEAFNGDCQVDAIEVHPDTPVTDWQVSEETAEASTKPRMEIDNEEDDSCTD